MFGFVSMGLPGVTRLTYRDCSSAWGLGMRGAAGSIGEGAWCSHSSIRQRLPDSPKREKLARQVISPARARALPQGRPRAETETETEKV